MALAGENAASKPLRSGRTTGACAAAAVMAACRLRAEGVVTDEVALPLPGGSFLSVPIEWARAEGDGWAACVVKDGGDDPDVTHGLPVVAHLRPNPGGGLRFAAGEGVGVVTKPGLTVPVGEPAINPGPRGMIEAVLRVEDAGRDWIVTVAIPGGADAAAKTQNARLGVEGGLSVLGTTGIVRPYCRKAQRAAFAAHCSVARAAGLDGLILAPGNIGAAAVARRFGGAPERLLEVGNDWEGAFAAVTAAGFAALLIGGHPGKLGKLAAGAGDTHSRQSPPALDTLRALAAETGLTPGNDRAETTEGYFKALDPAPRKRLAELLAERVRERLLADGAVRATLSVWLCDMAGTELGYAGDMSAWES